MIAAANFVGLPLMFLSAILLPPREMPDWIASATRFNPVNWGVVRRPQRRRTASSWGQSIAHLGFLLATTAVTALFATWCFRAYQRSI